MPQKNTFSLRPRLLYALALLVIFLLAIGDHLTSPVLSSLAAPTELGSACAPCGAPCIEKNLWPISRAQ
jgi:hypothetical protein